MVDIGFRDRARIRNHLYDVFAQFALVYLYDSISGTVRAAGLTRVPFAYSVAAIRNINVTFVESSKSQRRMANRRSEGVAFQVSREHFQ